MESTKHRQIFDILVRAKHPVFLSDERVDGDSLGSSLALVDWMKSRGVEVPVVVTHEIPAQYLTLPHVACVTSDLAILNDETIDCVVTFDCSDANYIKALVDRIPRSVTVVNIDHHQTNAHHGDLNLVLTDSGSTADIIHRFFLENHLPISPEAATCLLAGICFDTTVFRNAATNERIFTSAADLLLKGARAHTVFKTVHADRSVACLNVWGLMLERIRPVPGEDAISTYLLRKDIEEHAVTDAEVYGVKNYLHSVINVDAIYCYTEKPSGVGVSMRSIRTDVGAIAKAHGGGGHARASGYLVEGARLEIDAEGLPKIVPAADGT